MRRALPALALLALLALGVQWWLGRAPPPPRALTAAELAALPDAQLASRLLSDLSERVLAAGGIDGPAWRTLPPAAGHVWALALAAQACDEAQVARLRARSADGAPGLAEAQAACVAMGLVRSAAAFAGLEQAGSQEQAARQRVRAAMEAEAPQRMAWLRARLDELAP